MENIIYIGNKIDKDTSENLGNFVEQVFRAGKETGMDQSTIVSSLNLISSAITPENVSISNCNFIGEKNVNVNDFKEED